MLATAILLTAALAAPPILPLPGAQQFSARVDNPWFPLRPGTVLTYRGQKDGVPGTDIVRVTGRARIVAGVRAAVVDDRLYEHGHLRERTTDWYAQDRTGNVWYLGEDTATLDAHGRVQSREGSWQAGVRGARAGIYMPADPMVGDSARQEFYAGRAEDQFEVLSLHTRVQTPATSSRDALLTQETTRLEPGTVDHKLYVRGVGTVREQTVRGGSEKFVLVRVRHA
jgi:hypothetical protein